MDIWGNVLADGPRRTVELHRDLAVEPAEVWSALTEPDRVARWIGALEVSGPDYVLTFPGGSQAQGAIQDCEPPHRLGVTWSYDGEPVSELRVTLAANGSGCTLTLVHGGLAAIGGAAYGARWEDFLGAMAEELGLDRGSADVADLVPAYCQLEARLVPGTVGRDGDGWTVSLDRLLDAAPADVWSALTEPERIGRWLWPVVQWPDDPARERALQVGDRFVLGDENLPEGQNVMDVLELDPGRRIAFSWGPQGESVRFEIEPTDDGTLLRLRQSATQEVYAAGRMRSGPDFAAGWHSLVDGLALVLQGSEVPKGTELWDAAYAIYRPTTD